MAEPEIDIRYSSMTQPLNRIVQYIRQQEYLIQGIFEKKLYQIPLNEVLYFETVDKKTFMYTQQKIFECKKTLSATYHHIPYDWQANKNGGTNLPPLPLI